MPSRILKFVQSVSDLFPKRPDIPTMSSFFLSLEFLSYPLEFLPTRNRLITRSSLIKSTNYIS